MAECILVVDDDDAIREFVAMALQDEGYEVVSAQDGFAALNIVKQMQLDLIILDMRMPIMDGWAFLMAYQDIPTPHAPVIAVSANNRAVAGTTVDVVHFMSKPFDLDQFLESVKKYFPEPNDIDA
jgi:CheY-like chemotaxis protein